MASLSSTLALFVAVLLSNSLGRRHVWMAVLKTCGPQVKSEPNKFGPIGVYEKGINRFPALSSLHRRVSRSLPLRNIPLPNLYTILQQPSSCHMTGPVRSNSTQPLVQPPRPPNAWILYRSDKLRALPPQVPGTPRRVQADVSKLISSMWRNESEDVRNQYERRADEKKAEHQARYPGYRFMPVKKEVKDRLREEKRLEKEKERAQTKRGGRARQAPYTPAPFVQPALPYATAFYYGPSGPSPPLSAASSPNNPSSSSDGPAQDDRQASQSTDASPGRYRGPITPSATASSSSIMSTGHPAQMAPSYQTPMPIVAPQPMTAQYSLPGPSQWQTPQQYQPLPGVPALAPVWLDHNNNFPPDGSAQQVYALYDLISCLFCLHFLQELCKLQYATFFGAKLVCVDALRCHRRGSVARRFVAGVTVRHERSFYFPTLKLQSGRPLVSSRGRDRSLRRPDAVPVPRSFQRGNREPTRQLQFPHSYSGIIAILCYLTSDTPGGSVISFPRTCAVVVVDDVPEGF